MKVISILVLAFSISCLSFSQNTKVVSHSRVCIVTDPHKGENSFASWAVFPGKEKDIRRIVMNLTLAYPADRAIAHWDYLDRVKILRRGGLKGENLDFEIGRMLTPYGSNFKEGWNYTWSVDVTDFQAFLRDSVEIEYIHSGYESPDLGWDLTIDFAISFGRPFADFIRVDRMWNGAFQYGNPDNDIEQHLGPIQIKRAKGSSFARFRIQHTGHGMDQPSGCSEFCSRWRQLTFDGEIIDHRYMWKECGDNPLYPQGGTWIFDRAYWCPGDLQQPDIIDIPLTKSRHVLDLNMEPFIASNIDQPKEQIASYLFQYSSPNSINDVAVEEILAPNNKENFNRFNPAGFNAIVKIRNLGSETLSSLDIIYTTDGFDQRIYRWKGKLDFYDTDLVVLPGVIDSRTGLNKFSIVLSMPNGMKDEWPADNIVVSEFNSVPVIPSSFVVDFMTNMRPAENDLYIISSKGDTVFHRPPPMLEAATNYSDTLSLPDGNYNLILSDTAGDGLEFWFLAEAGYGSLKLKDTGGNIIRLFESDCGSGIFYSFRADSKAVVDTLRDHLSVNIYPRMVKDYLTVYTVTNRESVLKLVITRDGEYVETHEYTGIKDSQTGIDVRHLPAGRYVMEIYVNGEHKMNRRFNMM
ncbi:MAG: peptide-N-glycosidase F-related protein [Marinilabiliaceae bacterium]|jgi:hypothetical protein|nr:peptide-N-glycosidase F-related protein [Marinilabiliaceae bacterium]